MNSENPYQPPPELPSDRPGAALPYPNESSKIRQVRVVAILMMVQGGLEIIMSGFLMIMALVLASGGELIPSPDGLSPEASFWFPSVLFGGIALIHFVVAGLHLYAGFLNYRYQSRMLGIVALLCGFATISAKFCFPTAMALMIYGLIVYLDSNVRQAFQRGESPH